MKSRISNWIGPLTFEQKYTFLIEKIKCYECQKGFRISGHLARHNKAEIHIKRVQELRELGIQTSQFHLHKPIKVVSIFEHFCIKSLMI